MEFVLVAPLVIALCAAVAQLGAWAAQRATASAAAFEAARAGAVTPGSAEQRVDVARRSAIAAVPGVRASARLTKLDGVRVVAVEVPVPMTLLGWDLPVRSSVSGHVPVEPE